MVMFLLCIKADLENVESVTLPKGSQYCLTVKHSAGDDTREGVYVSAAEIQELTGSRGVANFTLKWTKDSRHEAYLNVEDVKGVTRALTADDHGKFVPIIGFDCRGLEPVDWRPEDGFVVKAPSGFVWEDVDLSDKDWADYDEKSGESASIMELEWEFRVHKSKAQLHPRELSALGIQDLLKYDRTELWTAADIACVIGACSIDSSSQIWSRQVALKRCKLLERVKIELEDPRRTWNSASLLLVLKSMVSAGWKVRESEGRKGLISHTFLVKVDQALSSPVPSQANGTADSTTNGTARIGSTNIYENDVSKPLDDIRVSDFDSAALAELAVTLRALECSTRVADAVFLHFLKQHVRDDLPPNHQADIIILALERGSRQYAVKVALMFYKEPRWKEWLGIRRIREGAPCTNQSAAVSGSLSFTGEHAQQDVLSLTKHAQLLAATALLTEKWTARRSGGSRGQLGTAQDSGNSIKLAQNILLDAFKERANTVLMNTVTSPLLPHDELPTLVDALSNLRCCAHIHPFKTLLKQIGNQIRRKVALEVSANKG